MNHIVTSNPERIPTGWDHHAWKNTTVAWDPTVYAALIVPSAPYDLPATAIPGVGDLIERVTPNRYPQ